MNNLERAKKILLQPGIQPLPVRIVLPDGGVHLRACRRLLTIAVVIGEIFHNVTHKGEDSIQWAFSILFAATRVRERCRTKRNTNCIQPSQPFAWLRFLYQFPSQLSRTRT